MIRQLIIPGIIAGALHGGLLLIPGTPTPPPPKGGPVVVIVFPDPPQIPPIIDQVERDDVDEQTDLPPPVPFARDIPVPVTNNEWTTPWQPDPPQFNVDPNVMRVGLGDITKRGLEQGTGGIKGLIDMAKLDKRPRTVFQIAPEYPYAMKSAGVTGEVTVGFSVDENGNVYDAHVISATNGEFGDAAVRAVSRWRFEPGRLNGKRVAFRTSVPIAFNLNDAE